MNESRAAGLAAAAVPDAVRTSVLDRLTQLRRGDRSVLMCASVIGRCFEVAVLIAAAARTRAQIDLALERGCRLQLIEPDEPDGERFSFRHALTRDVIYGELVASRTRPLHRRIGRALEHTEIADGAIEQLAYHWWAARDARRGVRYNELAGDRAAALYATDHARTHYGRALSLTKMTSPEYARLTLKAALLDKAQ